MKQCVAIYLEHDKNPRIYYKDEYKLFNPSELGEKEIEDNIMYINANIVEFIREATTLEARERQRKGRAW